MVKTAIDFKFDQENHVYTVNGQVWPHPTGLLQEFGLLDFTRVPVKRLNYKRDLGLAVDYACDLWERDNLDETTLDRRILPYFNAYKKFRELSGFEPDLEISGNPSYSKKWRFGFTPDLVGTLEGETVVIDRKCTWTVYPAAGPQLVGYKIGVEERYGLKVKKLFALKLNGNGNFDGLKEHEFKAADFMQDFLGCVFLHWRKRNYYKTSKGEIENEQRTPVNVRTAGNL